LLSGRRAFAGETSIDTMTAILKEDPPDLPIAERHIPPALARIVDRCLEKQPAARFGTAGDLAFALEGLSSHSDQSVMAPAAPVDVRRVRVHPAWIAVALLMFALAAALVLGRVGYLQPASEDTTVYRTSLLPPPNALMVDTSPARRIALSPDGTRLAFTATAADGRLMLWVRPLNSLTAQPLAGTEDAVAPFWSPDSRFIGFATVGAAGTLRKIDASGGPPITLCSYSGSAAGATWNRDGVILFTATGSGGGPIFKVSDAGGAAVAIRTPVQKEQELEYFWPSFLPDGRHYLYLALGDARAPRGIYLASLDSDERKLLVPAGSNARYANGYLLFLRDSTLMAQRFDLSGLNVAGDPVPVAEAVQRLPPTGAFTVSDTGLLAYQAGAFAEFTQLVWFDRGGKQVGTLGDPSSYGDLRLSPDGKQAAVTILNETAGGRDVWTVDVARALRTRLTFDPVTEVGPVWSADSTRIFFLRSSVGSFQKPSSGAGTEEQIAGVTGLPGDMSRDGKFLLLTTPPTTAGTGIDLLVWPQGAQKATPFLQTPFNEQRPVFSPDGRWVAYDSNESGTPQVYVRSFPNPGGKWQVSTKGGTYPRWRKDGKELYYVSPDNTLMAAAVTTSGDAFQPGAVTALFPLRIRQGLRSPYDVTQDGQRFLVNTASEQTTSAPVTLVVNWPAALKK
jgi:Tol biopolymer transport system component